MGADDGFVAYLENVTIHVFECSPYNTKHFVGFADPVSIFLGIEAWSCQTDFG